MVRPQPARCALANGMWAYTPRILQNVHAAPLSCACGAARSWRRQTSGRVSRPATQRPAALRGTRQTPLMVRRGSNLSISGGAGPPLPACQRCCQCGAVWQCCDAPCQVAAAHEAGAGLSRRRGRGCARRGLHLGVQLGLRLRQRAARVRAAPGRPRRRRRARPRRRCGPRRHRAGGGDWHRAHRQRRQPAWRRVQQRARRRRRRQGVRKPDGARPPPDRREQRRAQLQPALAAPPSGA